VSLPIPEVPTLTGAFSISDGVRTVPLPSTISSDTETRGARPYSNSPDGVSGSVFRRGVAFDPITLQLSGPIMGQAIIRDLSRILASGRVTITRGGRALTGDVTSWSLKEVAYGDIWNFAVVVESNWFYWKGPTESSTTNPTQITNDGDFPVYPTISFVGGSGGATEVSVTIDGDSATFTGSIADGEELVVDCDQLTAKLEGANVLNGMNASFFTEPPRLLPGLNSITINNTGSADVTILWSERYIS